MGYSRYGVRDNTHISRRNTHTHLYREICAFFSSKMYRRSATMNVLRVKQKKQQKKYIGAFLSFFFDTRADVVLTASLVQNKGRKQNNVYLFFIYTRILLLLLLLLR